jgi:hypothetical protein
MKIFKFSSRLEIEKFTNAGVKLIINIFTEVIAENTSIQSGICVGKNILKVP